MEESMKFRELTMKASRVHASLTRMRPGCLCLLSNWFMQIADTGTSCLAAEKKDPACPRRTSVIGCQHARILLSGSKYYCLLT